MDLATLDPRLWPAAQHGQYPRRFALWREVDASGVSGTGLVALGSQFPCGRVALVWQVPPHHGIEIQRSVRAVLDIHGHHGDTVILWFDGE